jgi:hypothetical protein
MGVFANATDTWDQKSHTANLKEFVAGTWIVWHARQIILATSSNGSVRA